MEIPHYFFLHHPIFPSSSVPHHICSYKVLGVVACTCNPATLEAEFQKGVSSMPVEGESPSFGGWTV